MEIVLLTALGVGVATVLGAVVGLLFKKTSKAANDAVMSLAAGIMLAAAMLPCICGAMHGVTPPYCACVYTGMGIAQSELKPTLINCIFWIIPHYLLSVLILLEWLPVWGLV